MTYLEELEIEMKVLQLRVQKAVHMHACRTLEIYDCKCGFSGHPKREIK